MLQRNREQAGSDLFASRDDRVIFAGVVQRRQFPRPGHKFVGLAGHRGDDNRDAIAAIDLALNLEGDVSDSLEVGNRRSAELHDESGHGVARRCVQG